jgi:hypothetical protein
VCRVDVRVYDQILQLYPLKKSAMDGGVTTSTARRGRLTKSYVDVKYGEVYICKHVIKLLLTIRC